MFISDQVADDLKSYVYVYIDPRDGLPFYVGKGKGNRVFQHMEEDSESEKVAQIKSIIAAGLTPQIDILRYGLSDKEALLVEASCIDLLGRNNLTNLQSGHESTGFGRISTRDAITMLTAKPVDVLHSTMLITINKEYRSSMGPDALYEATRGIWKVGSRRESVDYAMAVYQGIVREVYKIDDWQRAGTTEYFTRDTSKFAGTGRWEFTGAIAPEDIRDTYVGNSVGKGGQNPIRYVNA